jgi:hypothetical protein
MLLLRRHRRSLICQLRTYSCLNRLRSTHWIIIIIFLLRFLRTSSLIYGSSEITNSMCRKQRFFCEFFAESNYNNLIVSLGLGTLATTEVLLRIWVQLMKDHMREFNYLADMAYIESSLVNSANGVQISITGNKAYN